MKKWKWFLTVIVGICIALVGIHGVCGSMCRERIMSGEMLELPEGATLVYYSYLAGRWDCVIAWEDLSVYDELLAQIKEKDCQFALCPVSDEGNDLQTLYSIGDALVVDIEEFVPAAIRKATTNFGGVVSRSAEQVVLYLRNPYPFRL